MTHTLRRPIFVMAAMVIAAMWVAEAVQAGAPKFSPPPTSKPFPQAQAGQFCGTWADFVRALADNYGEVRRGGGISGPPDQTVIIEIWASEATGTWTILKTTPDGKSCVMAVGNEWRDDTADIHIGNPA